MRILAATAAATALVDTDAATMAIVDLPVRARDVADLIRASRADHVLIEPPPTKGAHYASGAVEAAATVLGVSLIEAAPAKWRKLTLTVADERQWPTRAAQLLPAHHRAFTGKLAGARAHAALLGWYGASALDRPPTGPLRVADAL